MREHQAFTAAEENTQPEASKLLEEALRRENLMAALRRVQSNKGASGVDGMTVEALTPFFKLSRVKIAFEELDQWIQRKLRLILWRQWKRPQFLVPGR